MDLNFDLNNDGTRLVPNPEYNPKSKKNKVPATISVKDLEDDNDQIASIAKQSASNFDSYNTKDVDTAREKGFNYNHWENFNKLFAEQQGRLSKIGNMLLQTGNELVLGTAITISDLFDMIGQATGISDEDYSNPVTEFLEEKKQEFNDNHQIYVDPETNITNGGLTDLGWWAKNIPSVASSLTLLIPSTGVTQGVSALGKAAKINSYARAGVRTLTGAKRKINKVNELRAAGKIEEAQNVYNTIGSFSRWANSASTANKTGLFLETGLTAGLSRAMENYQEARQTYNDMYKQAFDTLNEMTDAEYSEFVANNSQIAKEKGLSEQDMQDRNTMAKLVAIASADKTFQMDWINAASDLLQVYALRNAWKGIKNAEVGSGSIRRSNIDAAKYFGKQADEIKDIKAKNPFMYKVGEYVEDKLYSGKTVIGAELSEGLEEAINYIAQQEGMSFGKAMLDGKAKEKHAPTLKNSIASLFDTRILQYAEHPELLDAAFWGVAGGVAFQGIGSKFNQLKNAITQEKSDATQTAKDMINNIFMSELPEIKRRKSDIEARAIDFAEYSQKLAKIKKGIDITRVNTDGTEAKFDSKEAQELAEERLKNKYIAKMTIRAMNNGNLDLLKAYMADNNVRKGMIESGLFTPTDENTQKSEGEIEAESKKYIEDALRQIDTIEKAYDFELNAVDNAASLINVEYDKDHSVPVEYIQMIAVNNVKQNLDINNTRKKLNAIDERIAQLEEDPNNKLDKNIDYNNAIRVGVLTNQLGQLRSMYNSIKDNKSLTAEIVKHNIKNRIDNIESQLNDVELKYATFVSLQYYQNEKGDIAQYIPGEKGIDTSYIYRDKLIQTPIDEGSVDFAKYDNEILDNLNKRALSLMTSAQIGEYKALEQDAQKAFNQLRSENKELSHLYKMRHLLNQRIANDNLNIYRTEDEVRGEINRLHNTMDAARVTAISSAIDNINRMYKEADDTVKENIKKAIIEKVQNRSKTINVQGLSPENISLFNDAIEYLGLDKAHNKELGEILAANIDSIDVSEATRDIQPEVKTDQNSTNSNDAISATQNQNQQNVSSDNNKVNTSDKNKQNSDKSKLSVVTLPQNDSYQLDAAQDNTYTLTAKDSSIYNVDGLFGDTSNIDLTRDDVIVDEKPVLSKVPNKANEYYVEKPGRLIYANNITTTSTNLTDDNQQIAKPENPQPSSSTGGLEQKGATDSTNTTPIINQDASNANVQQAPVINQNQDSSVADEMCHYLTKLIIDKKGTGVSEKTVDDAVNETVTYYMQEGHSRDEIHAAIDKVANSWKNRINRLKNKDNKTTMQSCVDEVMIEQFSSIIENDSTNFASDFVTAVDNLINQYCKELGSRSINGKIYISLEDMLSYINETTTDKNMANFIYQSVANYLTTEEAQKKYTLTDQEIGSKEFVDNFNKTREERYAEYIANLNNQRIDILSFLKTANATESEDFKNALDEMKKGDSLKCYELNGKLYFKDSKGRICGTAPVPTVKMDGTYEAVNNGWVYNIDPSNPKSCPLADFFKTILFNKDDAAKSLNDIIFEYSYGNFDNQEERKQELIKLFKNNELFNKAVSEGLIIDKVDPKVLLDGLSKLWKFARITSNTETSERNEYISYYLDLWFEKLRDSYDAMHWLSENTDVPITVESISDGEFIYTCENQDPHMAEKAKPISEALGAGINPSECRIAAADSKKPNNIVLSGGSYSKHSSVTTGRTFLVIPNRNGITHHVQAFPVSISDANIGQGIKDIKTAIFDHISELLDTRTKEQSPESHDNLYNFLHNVFMSTNQNNSLFEGIIINKIKNSDNIVIGAASTSKKSNYITIYKESRYGVVNATINKYDSDNNTHNSITHPVSSKEVIDFIKEIINDNVKFKIPYKYLYSDGKTDTDLNGVCNRKNGKFVITIGDKEFTYNSYNDFVIQNNVVKINTHINPETGSNFKKRSENILANQTLTINIGRPSNNNTPVEKYVTEQQQAQSDVITNKPINEQLNDILSSDSKSKGNDIADLIIENKEALTALKTSKLLPNIIIFDENFNTQKDGDNDKGIDRTTWNAEIDIKTGQVTVGPKWVSMFKNPDTRQQALRKLIHEQLHYKISKNRGVLREITSIYEEFKENLEKGINNEWYNQYLKKTGFAKEQADTHFKNYLFEDYSEDERLEEFLVESISSKELAELLNNIQAKEEIKGKRGLTLWQKIINAFSKLINLKINKGSLYDKEFKLIGRALQSNDTVEERKAKDKAEAIVNKIVEDGEKVRLTQNERYYIDDTNQMLYARVTSTIQADEKGHTFDSNSPYIVPSTNIGTGVDEFVRDFFLGKLDNLTEEELENQYPNASGSQWAEFRKELVEFKQKLNNGTLIKGKKITIVSRDIKANGTVPVKIGDTIKQLPVNGTLDLLGYDEDGNFHIFDMKTVHSNSYLTDVDKSNKWKLQLSLYKKFLEDRYNIKVDTVGIIPIKVQYPHPEGSGYGDAKYEVKNPEKHLDYNDPTRTQLLVNDEEFKDAKPQLQNVLLKQPTDFNIQYDKLDENSKALVDETVTYTTFNDVKEDTSTKPITPEKTDTSTDNSISDAAKNALGLGKLGSRRRRSTVTEVNSNKPKINVMSINGFIDLLPNKNKANFVDSLTVGDISASCR